MKVVICMAVLMMALTGSVRAEEVPGDLRSALPERAEELLESGEFSTAEGFLAELTRIFAAVGKQVEKTVRTRVQGAASVLLAVLLCGAVEGFARGTGAVRGIAFLPMAGALSVTLLSAGSFDTLMGLGQKTIGELETFSHVLLPTLAAATAAAGSLSTATVQQVTTVFLVDLLIALVRNFLLPLVYLYIAVLASAAALPEGQLDAVAGGLKKLITWVLTTVLLAFTLYLSVARVLTGAVDGASIKVAKAAISGVVPVVGGIISEAAETVLAGAGVLRNTVGIFGTLAILAACAYPFLQLGVQYLLYKAVAFLASALGVPRLCKLIDGLGGAFGLILGMTGSCALLLMISVLTAVAAVTV